MQLRRKRGVVLGNGIRWDTCEPAIPVAVPVSFMSAMTFEMTVFGRAVLDEDPGRHWRWTEYLHRAHLRLRRVWLRAEHPDLRRFFVIYDYQRHQDRPQYRHVRQTGAIPLIRVGGVWYLAGAIERAQDAILAAALHDREPYCLGGAAVLHLVERASARWAVRPMSLGAPYPARRGVLKSGWFVSLKAETVFRTARHRLCAPLNEATFAFNEATYDALHPTVPLDMFRA